MSTKTQNPGEGNREADREYRKDTRDFVESGQVDDRAREAEPASDDEAAELREAERAGRARAKEVDPAVDRDYGRKDSH